MKAETLLPDLRFRCARQRAGNSLLVTMVTAAVITAAVGLSIHRSTSTMRTSARATNFASASRVADGVMEYAYGTWKSAIVQKDSPLSKSVSADNAVLTAGGPTISGFTYSTPLNIDPVDAYGNPTTTPVAVLTYLP